MIAGIGTDIFEHSRLEGMDFSADPFIKYAFSSAERAEGLASTNPLHYFAGRFCVKEAVIKAFNGWAETAEMRDIETIAGAGGAPEVHMRGALEGVLPENMRVHVSISHDAYASVAFVVGELMESYLV